MDADPFIHMSSYTNTILAKQCIMSSDKLLEKFTQYVGFAEILLDIQCIRKVNYIYIMLKLKASLLS